MRVDTLSVERYRQEDGTYVVPVGHDGTPIHYREVNGAFYHLETDPALVTVLDRVRAQRLRVRIALGDPATGRAWDDRPEEGYLDLSRGPICVPILVARSNSDGGGALLDHCVISVDFANKRDGGRLWPVADPSAG